MKTCSFRNKSRAEAVRGLFCGFKWQQNGVLCIYVYELFALRGKLKQFITTVIIV